MNLPQPFTAASFGPIPHLPFSSKAPIRMRPEIQTQLDNAKQSIGLLRRHL
jgi:hypothetical protein